MRQSVCAIPCMPADFRPVPLSTLANLVTHIFVAWEQKQAELGVAAGPGIAGAAYSGVDERVLEVLGFLTSRLEKIEAAIKFQKAGGAAALVPRNWRGKGLDGFRAGSGLTPPVGFDRENRRALPLCHRCGKEGEGKKWVQKMSLRREERGGDGLILGVLSELEALTGQVRAMEERVVPPAGSASAGGALAAGGYMAHVSPPTEEFPGGVEMIPPTAVPPSDYWQAEGYYAIPHNPHA
ncbi:hypothetical protein CYMTET_16681 [Cymbomonas tetramitiformis]|uniref:Uncharacterized protein n=1 Tax=Cymbomonas tetramitiformis TaxID=36881 RepID=A0AAE0L7W8_9CHLO|nr:hypothetical protein CYMTET_16681 [Cymbomonas tetramitiformis]